MYNFWVQSYSTYKGLFYWLNLQGYIANIALRPIVFVIMFALLGRFAQSPEAAQWYALGISVLSARIVVGGIAQSYAYERTLGTISFFIISPVSRFVNFLSRAVLHYPNALLCFAISLVTAWVIVGLDFGAVNWAGFITAVLVVAASLTAFSQLIGIFAMVFRNWIAVVVLPDNLLLVLTGVVIPLTVFPAGVVEFAKLLPITNGMLAIRDTFVGAPFSQVSGDILREAITGVVYYALGIIGFLIFERVARRRGSFEE